MIKLFSLKQQKKDEESAGGNRAGAGGKKASAAQLRIQKDINELNLPKTCEINFPDDDDLLNFRLIIYPDEGFYKGGKFVFSFKVGQGYPHDPPKVKCDTMVYHPNIDLEGNVCLNILREDWKPVLTINSIIYGLQYLFLEPNPEDPLNKEAAEVLQMNRRLFEQGPARWQRQELGRQKAARHKTLFCFKTKEETPPPSTLLTSPLCLTPPPPPRSCSLAEAGAAATESSTPQDAFLF
ncbi:NEDD8-conjugating enzyme Ubc12 [Plectropomus leopardus]|uniref:NEDD8-conjugating enzyme Ubc12 n=1 Tax=Plectropomus leopardus TaxID=160734 RepID=UPI001C4BD049|nr:NEDD8-conjugating enzyme Ubc12 [Plectropomus leopardus]